MSAKPATIWQGGVPACFDAQLLREEALRYLKAHEWSIPQTEGYRRKAALDFGVASCNVSEFWRLACKLAARRERRNAYQRGYERKKRQQYNRAVALARALSARQAAQQREDAAV